VSILDELEAALDSTDHTMTLLGDLSDEDLRRVVAVARAAQAVVRYDRVTWPVLAEAVESLDE
jgi:hypothetical protein